MNNHILMTAEFERQKNLKASAYTLGIAGAVFLFLMLIRFTSSFTADPPKEEAIEVNLPDDTNLGSSDQGSGHNQPQLPDDPAPTQQTAYVPSPPVHSTEESVKDVDADETHHEAPPIIKPTVSKPDATKINAESKTVTKNTTPHEVTTPPTPHPRAVMGQVRGGNGTGGNGADTYKPGGDEGISGGHGDQGRPGGNPNGTNYTGQPKHLGVKIVNIPSRDFVDDFNQSGKVMLDVSVDENGRLLSATYQPRGSSISNRSEIAIAQRRAGELSYPKMPGGFKQTLQFEFQVKN